MLLWFHSSCRKGCLNARDAYEEMYNNLYDLIISAIMMPEIDGFEFAESVRKINKHIPILFMSAKDDLPSKQKGFNLGIDDYMVKPVVLEELRISHTMLALPSSRQVIYYYLECFNLKVEEFISQNE